MDINPARSGWSIETTKGGKLLNGRMPSKFSLWATGIHPGRQRAGELWETGENIPELAHHGEERMLG